MSLYNYRGTPQKGTVTKFDDDLNIESSYTIEISDRQIRCGCPAGGRQTCRHREMFTQLRERMNTAWMFDFDTRQWVDPTGEAALSQSEPALTIIDDVGPVDWEKALATPQRIAIEGNPTSESQRESFLRSSGLTPRDDHPFRRRM